MIQIFFFFLVAVFQWLKEIFLSGLFWQTYTIVATATDMGTSPRSKIVDVVVTVTQDVSILPPVWDDIGGVRIDDYEGLEVPENETIGSVIISLNAALQSGKTFLDLPYVILYIRTTI